MPDYLGEDQRRVNKDEDQEKIKGEWNQALHPANCECVSSRS